MQNCLFCGISRGKRRSGKRNQSEGPWLVISLNQTSEEHRKADVDKWTHGIYTVVSIMGFLDLFVL